MRFSSRALAPAVLSLSLVGLAACSSDNEDFVRAQAAANASKEVKGDNLPPPKNQAEYGKRQQQQQNNLKQSGYPGAK